MPLIETECAPFEVALHAGKVKWIVLGNDGGAAITKEMEYVVTSFGLE